MTGPEIVQFAAALNEAFAPHELIPVLQAISRKFTDYATATLPFPRQLEELVAAANSQSWIAQLVTAVVQQNPNKAIKDFLAAYPEWDPAKSRPLAHPCDALRVFGGRSFIGRADLRKFLKKMSAGDGKNVLLVTGEHRKIGKTYSKELVIFLSAHRPPSGVAYVDLDNDNYDPAKLVNDIAKGMRLDSRMPHRGRQQASRWNQELSKWLIPEIPDPKRILWWIVLDGFRQRMPSEEVQDLIAQIAQRVQSTQDYRLVLVDYVYSLPVAVSGFMFREKIAPIQRPEIEFFLKQIHQQRYGSEPDEAKLSEYIAGVDDKLAEYTRNNPEMAENQLLLNMAVTDAVEIIREE
jgi:hypothetical protein